MTDSSAIRPKRRDAYHHGDLRRALIDSALVLLEKESSPRDLSLRAAARLAGVSSAAPYRHFNDRRALLAAIAEEGFGAMIEAFEAVPDDGPLVARVQALGVAYVRFAAAHPTHYRVMFSADIGNKRDFPALREAAASALSFLLKGLEACQKAGELRGGDLRQHALSAWSMVHGLSTLLIDDQVGIVGLGDDDVTALAERVARDLVTGLQRG